MLALSIFSMLQYTTYEVLMVAQSHNIIRHDAVWVAYCIGRFVWWYSVQWILFNMPWPLQTVIDVRMLEDRTIKSPFDWHISRKNKHIKNISRCILNFIDQHCHFTTLYHNVTIVTFRKLNDTVHFHYQIVDIKRPSSHMFNITASNNGAVIMYLSVIF